MIFHRAEFTRRVLALAALLGAAAVPPAAAMQPAGHGPDLEQSPPGYCASFDAAVKRDGVTLRDYVTVEPAADVAVTAKGKSLCLQGLLPGQRYEVTVRAGLPAADGGALAEAVSFRATVPSLAPVVRIAGSGFVLPRAGSAGLGIETVNVSKLRIRVLRAGDRLAARLDFASDPENYTLERIERDDARLVWTGEMEVKPRPNAAVVTSFPLAEAVPERTPGVYLVIAEDAALKPLDENGYWWDDARRGRSATRWLVETDLAPTTYGGADGLTVVARSLSTAAAVSGVRTVLVAQDNAILGEARTDGDGLARFAPGLLRGKGGARPKAVMLYGARGDFTLMELDRAAFDFSDRGAEGALHRGERDAYVWTERGIYRPGETVHAALLLRTRDARAADPVPVTLVVRRPDGVEHGRATVRPRAGGAALDFALSSGARRGAWTVTALLEGSATPIGEAGFEVQDFVPPRLKVELDPVPADVPRAPGNTVALPLSARFLYGAPGADLDASGTFTLARDPKPFPAFADFAFGPAGDVQSTTGEIAPVRTDAEGRASLTLDVPAIPAPSAPMRLEVTAEVAEPGGRTTKDQAALPVRGSPVYLGLRPLFTDGRAQEDREAAFDLVALDPQGRPLARPGLRWALVRVDRDFVWYRDGGNWGWRDVRREVPVASGEVATTAERPARIARTLGWGTYRLKVEDAGAAALAETEFYVGWYGGTDREGAPDKVAVGLDRPAARPGETVQVRVTPPFAGQLQLVVASDRVHEVRAVEVEAEDAGQPVTLEVEVDEAWGAGAYALVGFVRPVEAKAGHRPVRAVGLAWIGVDSADRALAVAVQAPERVRPRQRVEVPVTVKGAEGAAFVTLAAVDEGILDLTGYDSPDPLAHFFAKRRLGVEMRDQYGRLLDGNAGPAGAIRQGGDAGAGGAGLPVNSSKVVALFSGMVEVRDGRAVVPLDVPDFAGSLRLMAVAWDAERMGSAEADMLVRDPLVAEVVLPRFLAPGDTADATLLLHNVEGQAGEYRVAVTPTGPLSVADPVRAVTLAAGERRVLPLALEAKAAGIAGVTLAVEGPGGLSLVRDWDLALRPAHAPLVLSELRQQQKGERFEVSGALLEPFQPGTASLSVSYSRLPNIDVPGLLRDLNRYPYGCTEQTVSVAMPLLDFPGVAGRLGLDSPDNDTGLRVETAILRVLDRQRPDGTFGLWGPGDDYGGPWLQMYVLDFLQRAAKAGHAVPPASLAALTGWVERYVGDNVGGRGTAVEAAAYGAWLLARDGRASLGDLRYLNDRVAEEAEKARRAPPPAPGAPAPEPVLRGPLAQAQLAAALVLAGDRRRAEEAFARARAALGQAGGDHYGSAERDAAGTLAVAASVGDRATVDAAGDLVARQAGRADPWAWNTQQKGWLLRAAEALLQGQSAPAIAVDGIAEAAAGAPALAFQPTPEQLSRGMAFSNEGEGAVWRSVMLKGVPKVAPPPVAKGGLTLEKSFRTLDGGALDPASLPRNSRIVVVLEGRLTDIRGRRTLVLVDPLPAGWEIETVLKRGDRGSTDLGWPGEVSRAALREGRDDRFVGVMEMGWEPAYGWEEPEAEGPGRLAPGRFRFVYIARAVTPGRFVLPPATVEDMYDSGTIARTAAGTATVTAPAAPGGP